MIKELGQGVDGLVEIARYLPGQTVRTIAALPEPYKRQIIEKVKSQIGLGSADMAKGYFFNEPQLFKMPKKFSKPGPPLTQSMLGSDYILPYPGGRLEVGPHGTLYETMGYAEPSEKKALPFIVMGIVGVIAYNMIKKK